MHNKLKASIIVLCLIVFMSCSIAHAWNWQKKKAEIKEAIAMSETVNWSDTQAIAGLNWSDVQMIKEINNEKTQPISGVAIY